MSPLGQKRTWEYRSLMSAIPPKADIVQLGGNVRFVPITDMAQTELSKKKETASRRSL
jgi:hypothetical protein